MDVSNPKPQNGFKLPGTLSTRIDLKHRLKCLHRILYLTGLLFNTWDKIKPLKKTTSQNFSIKVEGSQKNFLMEAREMDREGNGTPLQYSCLENPMDGGA